MDRKVFFDHVRADLFAGHMTAAQVDGIGRILDEAERRPPADRRFLAYRLATTFHETGRAMVPVREGGGESYLRAKPYYPWVGEGLVQVTWERNARLFGATKPGDCMSWPVALRALFDGMDRGTFTGRKLSTYFTALIDDPVGARHIINGSDKAALIATYHGHFLAALKAAAVMPVGQIAREPGAPVLNGIVDALNAAAADQARAAAGLGPAPAAAPAPVPSTPTPPPALSFWARLALLLAPRKAA